MAQALERDYFKIAADYAAGVVAGEIPACEYVRLACQRQIDDLDAPDFKYRFDVERAEHVCFFVELLPHIKGRWAGKALVLEPWQVFVLTTVFGWVDEHGHRRYKTAYIEVPRKNGKSALTSGIALYTLVADGESGAEVYSAATTREQARIVFDDSKRMVERCEGIRERFGVKTSAHAVFVEEQASTFRALSRDQGGNHDGLNVHAALVDELHGHKTRDIWDVLETATGSRTQPLLWAITTAGFDRAGICYEQRDYTLKILQRSTVDDEYFGIVYTVDEGDDWTQPEVWAKANPNWSVSVNPEDIERKARKAQETASAVNNFLTKHLNIWVNADRAWMDMRAWDRCGDPYLKIEDCAEYPCWIACDLASKKDIASVAILFSTPDGYRIFTRNYLPEDAAEESSNSQYSGWVAEKRLITTEGCILDFAVIEADIIELCSEYDYQEVIFDPFQAVYIITRLMEAGLTVVEYQNVVKHMSEPMKELEALVLSGRIKHDCDPCMTWMVGNVTCKPDFKDNVFPRKEFPQNKIDGCVATIMALGRALAATDSGDIDDFLLSPISA